MAYICSEDLNHIIIKMYNLSNINGTGIVPFISSVNTQLMGGMYGILMLLVIGVILFMAYVHFTNDPRSGLGLSSLITAVFSVFFLIFEWIDVKVVLVAWVVAAIFAALSFFTSD